MSFFWLIMLFVFLILAGTDRRIWGSMWSDDWSYSDWMWGWGRPLTSRRTDFEIRRDFRRAHDEEVVVVTADDRIDSPDIHLETLIEDGNLVEARKYRLEMEKIAEEMEDDYSLRKYAIYGARIARKQREIDDRKAKEAREEVRSRDWLGFEKRERAGRAPVETVPFIAAGTGSDPVRSGTPPLWRRRAESPAPEPAEPEPSAPAPPAERTAPPEPFPPSLPPPPEVPSEPAPSPASFTPPEPPEPVEVPAEFVPPPPGPIQLGEPARSASSEEDAAKKPESSEDEKEPATEEEEPEKIDPDDFTELIDL